MAEERKKEEKKEKKTCVWVVYHLIHVTFPYEYIPKLFITDVPEDEEVTWDLVDEYKWYGEFGILHANHYIRKLTPESPPALKRAWRNKEARIISYDKLLELKYGL